MMQYFAMIGSSMGPDCTKSSSSQKKSLFYQRAKYVCHSAWRCLKSYISVKFPLWNIVPKLLYIFFFCGVLNMVISLCLGNHIKLQLWQLLFIPQSHHTPGPSTGCSQAVLNKNPTSIQGAHMGLLGRHTNFASPYRARRVLMHAL